jgi:hypothetical protein
VSFTPHEKVRIRHHLGYLNVTSSATFVLGLPQAVETQFIIENAMNLVLPEAETEVRSHLATLDSIEEQMRCDHELLAVEQVGEIKIRHDEQKALDKRYLRWRRGLSNLLGVHPNPFDRRYPGDSLPGAGINVPVRH